MESNRFMGYDHGTYDDFPLLMEAPWYQHAKMRTPEEIVQVGAGWEAPHKISIHGPAQAIV